MRQATRTQPPSSTLATTLDRLTQIEEQYNAVFAATSDGLVINDFDGNVVEVNPAFCKMHGYTREEMIAMHPTAFIHPDSHPLLQKFFETVKGGKRFRGQAMDVRKDGTSFHVDVHGVAFMYNGRPHILGIVRDINMQIHAYEMLRLKEEQYRAVFESTSDGLAIADLDANVVELNPAWCNMHGYTREEMLRLSPADYVHPDSLPLLAQYYEKVRAGERFQCEAVDVRKDGTPFHVEVHESPIMYNGKLHTLTILRDITERVQAYELLEQRVEERTHELSTLLDVSKNVASTIELQPLLQRILDQLKLVADFRRATIAIHEEESVVLFNSWGDSSIQQRAPGRYVPINDFGPIGAALRRGEVVIVPDVLADTEHARIVRGITSVAVSTDPAGAAETLEERLRAERCIMYVPFMLKDSQIGGITLRHGQPGYYTERHAQLAMAIANQAAIAIDNAKLYEQAVDNSRKTAAIAQTASQVAFGASLQSTLDILCRHVVDVTGAIASAVVLREADGQDRMAGVYGLPEGYAPALNTILASGVQLIMQDAFRGRQPMVMREMRKAIFTSPLYTPLHDLIRDVPWDTVVAVPMIYRDRVVGVLLSYHLPDPQSDDSNAQGSLQGQFQEAELTFHTVIADQAAVAVENSRLLAQAHDKARLEERQRLARDLHDSVTQALFSISLISRSAEMMIQREGSYSPQVMEKMADLRQLTQGALAEMRALIFELRPGALEEEGLLEALRKHAAAVQGREMMPVEVVQSTPGDLPRLKPAVEEALYRIAQEALHNMVKHAKATRAEVTLGSEDGWFFLRVTDDGIGFDPSVVPAGHMGLGTMGQRAAEMGADYTIDTTPGRGTTISVRVPLQ
jgi:PAS domain S-box-containing protein